MRECRSRYKHAYFVDSILWRQSVALGSKGRKSTEHDDDAAPKILYPNHPSNYPTIDHHHVHEKRLC